MKLLAIIPARGGSKGLKGKNIIDLAGKPLIGWTIKASLKSKYITTTVVSSNDDKILKISEEFGAHTIKRSDNLSQDDTSTESVIENVLKNIENITLYDYLILLQPTSPLRDEHDIDSSVELLLKKNASALISVKKIDNKILKAFKKDKNGYLGGISNNLYPFMPRQDLPQTYMPNGAIYIVHLKEFIKNKKLFTDKTISFLMTEEKSIDIDTKEDLVSCKKVILNRLNISDKDNTI